MLAELLTQDISSIFTILYVFYYQLIPSYHHFLSRMLQMNLLFSLLPSTIHSQHIRQSELLKNTNSVMSSTA